MIYDSEQTKVFLGGKEYRGQLLEKQLGTIIRKEILEIKKGNE